MAAENRDGRAAASTPSPGDLVRAFLERLPEELRPADPASPRGRILAAARRHFAERGFEATSTRVIAETAGVNQAMIHYYFQSKRRLYQRVVTLEIFAVFRHLEALAGGDRPAAEMLIAVPGAILTAVGRDAERSALLRRELGRGAPELQHVIEELGPLGPRGFRDVLQQITRAAQADRAVEALPVDLIARLLLSLSYGALLLEPLFALVLQGASPAEETGDRYARAVEQLLRRGLLTKGATS